MRSFSIKELQTLANIKAHTIRTWEVRYAVLAPKRTETNIRYYSLDDVRHLLALTLLTTNGYKISNVSKLSHSELQERIQFLKSDFALYAKAVNELIISMFDRNTEEFERVLNDCTNAFGIDIAIRKVIIPFLQQTNTLSYDDSSTEVHLVVTAVRKKIILGIERLSQPVKPRTTALLFLPKGEHYDLILLYLSYLAKSRGMNILYLGTNISKENLLDIVMEKQPDRLYTYVSPQQTRNLSEVIPLLKSFLTERKLFVATPSRSFEQSTEKNITFFHFEKLPE